MAFIAAQVWGDLDRATVAVNREASALRSVVLLAPRFPQETQTRLRRSWRVTSTKPSLKSGPRWRLVACHDARRQRIITSHATVNWVKWSTLIVQAICTMVAIALVHSDNRTATGIALGLFATGVAVSILLIAAHNRPFTGALSVRPDILEQVLPPMPASP